MLNLAEINSKINAVLQSEGKILKDNIQNNLKVKYPNFDYMRDAGNLIHSEVENNTLSVLDGGRGYFENTEKGIPKMILSQCVNRNVRAQIYQWSIKAGIAFQKDSDRRRFAYFTRLKVAREGTRHNKPRYTGIYTDEGNQAVERIINEICEVIINTKIL